MVKAESSIDAVGSRPRRQNVFPAVTIGRRAWGPRSSARDQKSAPMLEKFDRDFVQAKAAIS